MGEGPRGGAPLIVGAPRVLMWPTRPECSTASRSIACCRSSAHVMSTSHTWADIAAFVGQRSARVTSDVYTHVLLDDREVDHRALLSGSL
jgi:hypothetical protein